MTAISEIGLPPTMSLNKIRKTIETPPRVSVIDLIMVVSKVNNPREAWSGLQRAHPETVSQADSYRSNYKFPGRGNQTTPVINARGAIMIINLLPGAMAASFRAAWADIIVRYIAGDPTLAAEIEQNNRIQTELADGDPRRFCRQDVEARHIPKSVTGVQDIRSAQIYFGIAGPPEIWTDIRRSDGTLYTLKENEFLVKTGYLNLVDENTGRYGQHVSEYGFFRVSDSVLGSNPRLAEQKLKGWLRNENLLLSAKHVNKTTRDIELIAVTLVRYKEAVGKAIDFDRSEDNKPINIKYERELTKSIEEETKRMQMQTDVQKMQTQLEMLRLGQSAFPAVPSTSQIRTSKAGERDARELDPSRYTPQRESKAKHEPNVDFIKESPTEIIASSGHGLENIDSFAFFVDLAIRKNIERSAYFTIKAARKVWMELAKRPENHLLKVTPKEAELSANLSKILRQKCIPQTWIMNAEGTKQNARRVFSECFAAIRVLKWRVGA